MRQGILPSGFCFRSVSFSSSGSAGTTVMRPFKPSTSIAMRTLRPNGEVAVERSTKFSSWDMQNRLPVFFSLHSGVSDHFRPLLGFAVDVVAEVFRRVTNQDSTLTCQLLDHRQIFHSLDRGFVKNGDDLGRSLGRCNHSVPVFSLQVSHADL